MKRLFKAGQVGRRGLLIAVAVAALGPTEAVWAQERLQQVLVLYSTSRDAPMAVTGDRELPRILEQGLEGELAYFSEYIDQGRFHDPGYEAAFTDFLRVKYKGQQIDLIIAVQTAAVEFVNQRPNDVFPDTPVVFLSLSPLSYRPPNSTGVVANLDLASTLALAAALQPDLRHVFVVSGAGVPDKEYEREARAQLKPFEARLTITFLSGLATKDLEARLATLPDRSAVYYLVVYQDGSGEAFTPISYSDRISAVARAPTYTWSDALMDHGIVGGSLLDRQALMEAVAKMGLTVLGGERADSIPISSLNLNVAQVDWRQLRRWGISEARVPAGTLIRFREPSVWDRYKVYILSALAILLAQTALIAGLLVQRTKRQEAEAQMRGSYARVRDLGARLLNSQETERARIARELHDDISQQMALMTIDLELLAGAEHPKSDKLAAEVLTRAHDISRSVHDLSHRLHPAKLRLIGLIGSVQSLRNELSKSEIAIEFTHDNVPSALPPDVTLCLFRIVQEALQNALKYSRADEVSVHLSGNSEELTLVIKDDGVGFDVDAAWSSGIGLISMRERLEAIGGTLEIRSRPAAGTRLEGKVPLNVVQRTEPTAI